MLLCALPVAYTGALFLDLSQCRGFEILEREKEEEKPLPGQQIPPRTSKPLGFIPKQNKISLIFQRAGGEASLPVSAEPADWAAPLPAWQKGKRIVSSYLS